ncbi:MAG: type VI secretion system tip protein VgrG [Methylococcaceae bacterium]|nr:type VI secretion system tip protein VgrG [Methylococcaceae bacterium]
MSVFTITVLSDGQKIDPAYELLSIDVSREVNRIPYAQLSLIDGSSAQRKFAISDSGVFDIGKMVEIKLRYEDKPEAEKTVFKGLIITQSVAADEEKSVLTLEAKDSAFKMTQIRNTQVFLEQSDTQLFKKLIQAHGLQAGDIPDTKPEHKEIVQYNCTDWDFMLSRADVNGLLMVIEDEKIAMKKIELAGSSKHTFEYGISEIYNFEIEANASGQYEEVGSITWDIKDQKMTEVRQAKSVSLNAGDLDAKKLATTLGSKTYTLTSSASVVPDELQAWADAKMAKSRLSLIRGRISVAGFTDIAPMDIIEIKGIGKHFNGKTLVTGIRHRIYEQGWVTDLQFGLCADWFVARPDIAALPAAGLLPAVSGLHIGIVADFEEDPDKQFRVKVKIPALGEKQDPLWARLASPDAGKGRGFFFRPEKGDEVVLGFFNEDPRQPVIIGALFSSKNTPPDDFKVEKDNKTKGLVTKKGTTIGFDDEKSTVFIQTKKNKILLDEDGKKILLSDANNNTITMDKDGITLKSGKDFKIEASGNVEIKGSKVDVK